MPASENQDVRREKLLHGLFWGGMGLAPLAILVLLFGQSSGSLRVAVTLSVLTIVMLAVSIALRPSVEMLRVGIEHRVLDEVERVRVKGREDITRAARNTHRALSDKIHVLTETVDDLRAQIDDLQANPALPPPAGALGVQSAGPGVVRRTETVHVTRRTTTVDAGDDDTRGTVYGSRAAVEGEWRPADGREAGGARGDERWDGLAAGDRWASAHSDDQGRELRVGERRSSVHRDDLGTDFHLEDRWAAVRREDPRERRREEDYGESDWEATFRSLSNKQRGGPAALPPARGSSPDRYADDRDDAERVRSRERDSPGDRERDRDRHRERDDRRYAPRPRSPHPSEYDR